MNQVVPAQEVAGLIFQPAETLNRRVIDAEHEAKDLRKQRSRAVLLAVMASVAFLTCAVGAAFVLNNSDERVQQEVERRMAAEEQLSKVQAKADLDIQEAEDRRDNAVGQLRGLSAYADILNARVEVYERQQELRSLNDFYQGRSLEGLDPKKSFDVQPPAWNLTEVTRDNWVAKVEAAYLADALVYQDAVKYVKDWMVRTAQPAPPPKNCIPPNPQLPSPRDCKT